MKTLRTLAFTTAGFAYAVIVLGFVVRITNSGLGCGPDWPLCNGQIIPEFTSSEVVIEWYHRLAVVGLTVLTLAVAAVAWSARRQPGGAGRRSPLRAAFLAVGLLLLQSFLGALTVWLELPPGTVVLHLGVGLALLAAFVMAGIRAGTSAGTITAPVPEDRLRRAGVIAATVLGLVVVLFGGLTATTGAAPACQGFPLCSGRLWPTAAESGLPHIHWTHRLLAYGLFFHLMGLAIGFRKRGASQRLRRTAWTAFAFVIAQVAVGAVMVLTLLPPVWRGLHAAIGTALWIVLVLMMWQASGEEPQTT